MNHVDTVVGFLGLLVGVGGVLLTWWTYCKVKDVEESVEKAVKNVKAQYRFGLRLQEYIDTLNHVASSLADANIEHKSFSDIVTTCRGICNSIQNNSQDIDVQLASLEPCREMLQKSHTARNFKQSIQMLLEQIGSLKQELEDYQRNSTIDQLGRLRNIEVKLKRRRHR